MRDQRVLLLNMPWARVNAPCLGLSLLKPLAERESFHADVAYLNLLWSELVCRYHAAWLGKDELKREDLAKDDETVLFQGGDSYYVTEWIFSQSYYGHGSLDAGRYIQAVLPERFTPEQIRYWLGIRDLVPEFLEECLRRIDLEAYSLFGFTSQFRQNFSSLLLARLIKQKRPEARIVFGGSNCAGVMGETLLRYYPFVDFVADGEAEYSFPALLRALRGGNSAEGVEGIVFRRGEEIVHNRPPRIIENLDELPAPDFQDFFDQFQRTDLGRLVDPALMMELSRGCWWGMRSQCKFCGNHPRFLKYRGKSPERAFQEIRDSAVRYGVPRVDFADTILGPHYFETLLPRLAASGLELDFFFEVKSTVKKEHIRAMSRAGVTSVQPGIESFSTRLLRLMNKGVTALDNVQCLKWCAQYSITPHWNLLCGFPYEEPEDYAVIFEYVKRIAHLRHPLAMGPIRLDRFSPHFDHAAEYGFANIRPMVIYPFIYDMPPGDLDEMAYAFVYDYRDGRDPGTYVSQVRAFVDRWTNEPKGELIHFDLADGSGVIADSRFNRVLDRMELDPYENLVYKLCDEAIRPVALRARLEASGLAPAGERKLQDVLHKFVDSLLMVSEGERYLSVGLTVSQKPSPDEAGKREREWLAVIT